MKRVVFEFGFVCALATMPVLLTTRGSASADEVTRVDQRVDLSHPVLEGGKKIACTLTQFVDGDGYPVGYAMPIETEVCRDKVCRLATVTIYWDELGNFERLELPLGQELSKKDHTPFTASEYQRLDGILGDKNSVLKGFKIDEITSGPIKERVDGVTGATVLTVKEATVDGAAYTTYTLWHWVNGDIAAHLRDSTQRAVSPGFLKKLLRANRLTRTKYAFHRINDRYPGDPQFVPLVLAALPQCDRTVTFQGLEYLEKNLDDERELHLRLVDVFQKMDSARKLYVVEYLFNQDEIADSVFARLTESFDGMPYYPIHRILSLVESHGASTRTVQSNVAALLSHDNFFVARRAYEHLAEQEVTERLRKKLREFFDRHADRL
jgi:hypothetical protein